MDFALCTTLRSVSGRGTSCNAPDTPVLSNVWAPPSANVRRTQSGLQYYDQVLGHGASPTDDDPVTIHYGTFNADTMKPLESTHRTGSPFTFWLGDGSALAGVDEAVRTMKQGGRRVLWLPPLLAFGDRSEPPNMTLLVEVDLIRCGQQRSPPMRIWKWAVSTFLRAHQHN